MIMRMLDWKEENFLPKHLINKCKKEILGRLKLYDFKSIKISRVSKMYEQSCFNDIFGTVYGCKKLKVWFVLFIYFYFFTILSS